jgi:DNA-binding MarR family transcriptional regulator
VIVALAVARRTVSASPRVRLPLETPWHALREANFLLRTRWSRELERFQLSYSDYVVLESCGRGPARVSEVARVLGLTAAGTTDALDRLERRRLVSRTADRTDRRAVRIGLSPSGRRLLREAHAAKRSTVRYLNESMTPEEIAALSTGLAALTRALRGRPGGS